jgi:amino acid transporter
MNNGMEALSFRGTRIMGSILGGFGILAVLIVFIISPIISLFFRKKGFRKAWMKTNLFIFGVIFLIIVPIQIIAYYTEEKPLLDKMERQYQNAKDDLPKGNSLDKIFVEIYKVGTDSVRGHRVCTILINNYNNQEFNGVIKVKAVYEGKIIGEQEKNISLLANEKGYMNLIYANKLNIERFMWEKVKFEYELKGDFSK